MLLTVSQLISNWKQKSSGSISSPVVKDVETPSEKSHTVQTRIRPPAHSCVFSWHFHVCVKRSSCHCSTMLCEACVCVCVRVCVCVEEKLKNIKIKLQRGWASPSLLTVRQQEWQGHTDTQLERTHAIISNVYTHLKLRLCCNSFTCVCVCDSWFAVRDASLSSLSLTLTLTLTCQSWCYRLRGPSSIFQLSCLH